MVRGPSREPLGTAWATATVARPGYDGIVAGGAGADGVGVDYA